MTNDIRGLEIWEGETREWNRKAGQLRMKAGPGLIEALENWYGAWKTKHTDRNRREYLTWRLRLHRKWNNEPAFLNELEEFFDLGLHDEEIGPTYWDVGVEENVSWTTGYNWRRDSGYALRGGRQRKSSPVDEET
jgi:hypothetical protein